MQGKELGTGKCFANLDKHRDVVFAVGAVIRPAVPAVELLAPAFPEFQACLVVKQSQSLSSQRRPNSLEFLTIATQERLYLRLLEPSVQIHIRLDHPPTSCS